MKSLIITAHPEKWWTANLIAQAYAEQKKQNWNQTEIIDLYNTDLKLDFFSFSDPSNQKNISIWQSKILEADELVFSFPVWRWDSPAIFKNRFDNVLSPWFAYEYQNNRPVWLLNKKAKMILTCDWPKIFFSIFPISIKYFWKYMRLGFCGIKLTDFVLFDLMRIRKKKSGRENKIIQKVQKIASKW